MSGGAQGKNTGSGNRKSSSKQLVTMRSLATLLVVAAGAALLVWLFPQNREQVFETSWRFLLEMISILPAIVVLIGLFAVFVPKQMVADYLGHASGLKGFLLAALLGSLPTGPLYVAFPLAAAMLKKGARVATIIVFLTAWACIKLSAGDELSCRDHGSRVYPSTAHVDPDRRSGHGAHHREDHEHCSGVRPAGRLKPGEGDSRSRSWIHSWASSIASHSGTARSGTESRIRSISWIMAFLSTPLQYALDDTTTPRDRRSPW